MNLLNRSDLYKATGTVRNLRPGSTPGTVSVMVEFGGKVAWAKVFSTTAEQSAPLKLWSKVQATLRRQPVPDFPVPLEIRFGDSVLYRSAK